ncbi:MAG: hypothetical protein ABIA47_02575 [bacterium]
MKGEKQRVLITKTKPALSNEHKTGLALVIGMGGLSFLLGIFYVGSHLSDPFDLGVAEIEYIISEEDQMAEMVALQNADTDEDGLSDFDETYAYGTSPYLADTDGDGFSDADELSAGYDPVCARGTDCESALYDEDGTTGINPGTAVTENIFGAVEDTSNTINDIQSLLQGVSADEVRQMLIDSGADAKTINELSDNEIMAIYNQVLTDMEESGQLEEMLEESGS